MTKPQYVTVSFSGGKDSTAMLLHMIEIGEHIDEVINVDTGMEFPAMYDHIAKVRKVVEEHGIKYTRLANEKSFEYLMLHQEINSDKHGTHYGYGWPSSVVRWCTSEMKIKLVDNYFKQLKDQHPEIIQCIGLAHDEQKRIKRPNSTKRWKRYPLNEWEWEEKDCLEYCYSKGLDWDGLYRVFKRVSCWCCPLATISETRNLWRHYPELWSKLQEWDNYMEAHPPYYSQFKQGWSIRALGNRFAKEDKARREQKSLTEWIA